MGNPPDLKQAIAAIGQGDHVEPHKLRALLEQFLLAFENLEYQVEDLSRRLPSEKRPKG